MPTARYAILHHQAPDGEHWDLMLQDGAVLATWRLPAEPVSPAGLPMDAVRLGDHRMAYLDYEGPVSRDRGTVARVDAGTCRVIRRRETCWEFELVGGRLAGGFALVRDPERNAWRLRSV